MYAKAVNLVQTSVLDLIGDGGRYFHGLLMASDEELGWELPKVELDSNPIKLTNVLGQGASAVVFAGEHSLSESTKEEVVVKWFRTPDDPRHETETKSLCIVSSLYPLVPKLVSSTTSDRRSLVLQPVGRPFASRPDEVKEVTMAQLLRQPNSTKFALATANDLCLLLDIISQIHVLGIIHRDIKPSNFFAYNCQVSSLVYSYIVLSVVV